MATSEASTSEISTDSNHEEPQSSITGSTTAAQSALDKLKAPKLSDLSRKRKVAVNPPRGKRRCKSTNTSAAAASVPPQQRVKEFVGEHLSLSSGKLFCCAYREELNMKKSSVSSHV